MDLYNFHRVLISAAALFFFGLALHMFRQYAHTGQGLHVLLASISAAATAGFIGYLIYFNAALRSLRRGPRPSREHGQTD